MTDQTTATYDEIAEDYAALNRPRDITEQIQYFVQMLPGRRVLDIGCGNGQDSQYFLENSYEYVGIDSSKGMLEVAHQLFPLGDFRQIDMRKMNFAPASFDGIYSIGSVLHLKKSELPNVLGDIYRMLDDGGVFFTSVKTTKENDEGWLIEERFGKQIKRYFAYFSAPEFLALLEAAGFRASEIPGKEIRNWTWLSFLAQK